MSEAGCPCSEFQQIDLAAYVVDPDEPSWGAFKAHFPTCAECSDALNSFSEVEWMLGASGGVHPDLDELDHFAAGVVLSVGDRTRIDAHVAQCGPCADQVRALERFAQADAATATQPAPSEAHPRQPSSSDSLGKRLSEWFEGWLIAPVPAFAMAAAALIAFWLVFSTDDTVLREKPTPRLAEQPRARDGATEQTLALTTDPLSDPPTDLPTDLRTELPTDRPSDMPVDEPSGAPPFASESDSQLAQRAPEREPSAPVVPTVPSTRGEKLAAPQPEQPSPREQPRGEILIAALDWPGGLDYIASGGGGGRMDLIGRGGATPDDNPIQVVAPASHVGRVASTRPVLLWALPADDGRPVEIQIVDERAIDPLLRLRLPGPHTAGLHGIDLAEFGLRLDAGAPYVWSAAIIADEDRPSRNPRSQATILVADPTEAAGDRVASQGSRPAPSADRIQSALGAGFWYDGIGDLALALAAHPGTPKLTQTLGALLARESLPQSTASHVIFHPRSDTSPRPVP